MLVLLAVLATMVVPPMTQSELRARADVVVDGTVVAQHSAWVGRRIFTFSVVVAGTGTSVVSYVVALPGGDVGALSQRVSGAPSLALGGRYRMYLGTAEGPVDDSAAGAGRKSRGVVGFYRGVFLIDPAHNNELVPFDSGGLPLRSMR